MSLLMRITALLFGFWLLGSASAQVASETPAAEFKPLPPAQWPRTRLIDVKHLAIDLQFDWAKRQAYGTTKIIFAPLKATDRITLDAGMLSIASVRLDSGVPLKFDYDGGDRNDGLAIALDRRYRADEEVTIVIDYRTRWVNEIDPNNLWGSNGKGLRFSQPTSNDLLRPREIWSMGMPESNRYWFPGYDAPNDFRTTELTATVEQPLTVISNGRLVETRNHVDGRRSFHWKVDQPYANHLTSIVVGEYVAVTQSQAGVALHSYSYPHEVEATTASVDRLPDMLRFFSELTGQKYPHPLYAQVFVQDQPWGFANMGTATQSDNMVDDAGTHADFLYLWDGLEAEMLAQQWFGSHLMIRDWSQIWLSRAFAHYFDGLYNEHKNGRDEYLLWGLSGDHASTLGDWNAGIRHPIVTPHFEDITAFTSDNYSYSRGALVLNMLRKHLGEEPWQRAIRHYVKSHAGRVVATEDFRAAIEESTGESMGWFFDQWIYRMGHPVFEVSTEYDAVRAQLKLTVRQTQKIDPNNAYPQVAFFQGQLDVEIDGRIESIQLAPQAENNYTFAASKKPAFVNFDYESTWIKELKQEKSADELLAQLRGSKDTLARRDSVFKLAVVAKSESTAPELRVRIEQALRDLALSEAYWRLRMSAIAQLQSVLAPASSTEPVRLDAATLTMLRTVIEKDTPWTRAAALNFLGMTRDPQFADLYIDCFDDVSDRVISAAAIALGRSKSPKAFDALAQLVHRPSWKSQSLMSTLSGLKELGDPRGFDIAFKALADPKLPRWRLSTPPVWDYRVFAVDTIVALGKSAAVYPLIARRFKESMKENDLSGMFNNALLVALLGDARGQEVFDALKLRFKDDADSMTAVTQFETQFHEGLGSAK